MKEYKVLCIISGSTMPFAAGIKIPYFAEIVFGIIILTNLATTLGVFVLERKNVMEMKSQERLI
jgi:hypothetical protein